MMSDFSKQKLFVGIVEKSYVELTFSSDPWKPVFFIEPPYPLIKPFSNHLLTLGSGCLASMATISSFGAAYNSGIDVFRTDFDSKNPKEPLVNIDHYIAGSLSENQYAVFKDPTISYHWPDFNEEIINFCPVSWQYALRNLIQKKGY